MSLLPCPHWLVLNDCSFWLVFLYQAELTPSLFPRLYKQKQPFVISFVDDTETSREMLEPVQTLVRSGSFPDLIFCSLQWVLQLLRKYCKLVTFCRVFYFIWRTVTFSYSEKKTTVVIQCESFMSLHIFCCFVSRKDNIIRVHQQSLVNQILLLKDWVLILMVKSLMIWSLVV